ncbi:MAG: hypothetical protein ABI266_06120 [Ginsengibacter sp.]
MIIFIFGYNLKDRFKEFDAKDKTLLGRMFFYHMAFGVAYYFYIGGQGGDAEMYWGFPKKFIFSDIWLYYRGSGASRFVATLNYFPAHILDLSFFSGFMLYAFMGYIGWIYFYRVLKENVPDFTYLSRYKIFGFSIFPWILFLPNLHFWSAGIGKDALLFMCCGLFLYAAKNITKRLIPIFITVALAAFIRPHILLFLISAVGGATLIDKKVKTPRKVLLFVIFGAALIIMIPYVMDFVKLDSLDVDSVDAFASNRAASLSTERSASSVDTSNYPIILKVLTFLYRPLFFDASGFLGLMASFENIFLVFFSYKILRNKPYAAFKKGNLVIKSVFFFFIIGSTAFSMILGNLGIMLRQKTPFIVALIIFGFWVLTESRDFKIAMAKK